MVLILFLLSLSLRALLAWGESSLCCLACFSLCSSLASEIFDSAAKQTVFYRGNSLLRTRKR
jgi:hypothetical protein